MGYVIHCDNALFAVVTVVEGDIDVPLVTQFAQEAFASGYAHDYIKYLFDLRDTFVKESIVNIAEFAIQMEKTGIRSDYYVAVVIQNNEAEHQLFRALSKNQGYARIRYFYDIDAAHTWLHQLAESKNG